MVDASGGQIYLAISATASFNDLMILSCTTASV